MKRLVTQAGDELTDIGYQIFPDISWVYNKELKVSGPSTQSDYDYIEEKVLNSKKVLDAIAILNQEQGISINKLKKEAKIIYDSLSTKVNTTSTRSLAYVMRKFWRSAYDGVFVNLQGLKRIKKAIGKSPIILLPTHKSYADFIIISYLFYEHGMAIPRIISGNNLDFFGVGNFLKKAGAIWIRRSFSSDKLYQSVFQEYIHQLLRKDTMLECFIEGTRSRVGKVLSPKIGFIKTIINLLMNDKILWEKDIKLVPISISYDKLMESSAYTSESLGNEKKSESFGGFVNAVNKVTKLKFGSINVEIGDIISMKDRIKEIGKDSDLKTLSLKIAYQALYEMNLISPVSVSSTIATILLTECVGNSSQKGISVKVLTEKVNHLISLIKIRKGKISKIDLFDNMIDRALDVMSKLILNRDGILMVNGDNAYIELAMYRNSLVHYFIHESLVSIAILSLSNNNNHINKGDVMNSTQFLSKLLKHEFQYKPSVSFMDNFDETLDFMIHSQQTLCEEFENDLNILKINDGSQSMIHFLAMLIWPFIDIYWIISLSLYQLLPNKIVSQKEFAQICSKAAEIKYFQGDILFFECVAIPSINNALKWFITQGILTAQSVVIGKSTFLTQARGTTVSVYQLAEVYRDKQAIDELSNVIASYRKPIYNDNNDNIMNNMNNSIKAKL